MRSGRGRFEISGLYNVFDFRRVAILLFAPGIKFYGAGKGWRGAGETRWVPPTGDAVERVVVYGVRECGRAERGGGGGEYAPLDILARFDYNVNAKSRIIYRQ